MQLKLNIGKFIKMVFASNTTGGIAEKKFLTGL